MEPDRKRAFLVLGPESSGTRLATKILTAGGCHGQAGNKQDLDTRPPVGNLVVWRRSVPHFHYHEWPDIGEMRRKLDAFGYDVSAVVTSRDWFAMISSQLKAGHQSDASIALDVIQRAYLHIFTHLKAEKILFVVCSYEAIVTRPWEYGLALLRMIDLPIEDKKEFLNFRIFEEVYDGNVKWYRPAQGIE